MPNTDKSAHAAKMNKLTGNDETSIDEELEADQRSAELERAKDTKAQTDTKVAEAAAVARALSPESLLQQNREMKAQLDALQATLSRLTPSSTDALYTFPTSPRDTPRARLLEMFPDGKKYPQDRSPEQMRAEYVRSEWGKSQDGLPFDRCWD